jgi:hypothetical protein
MIIFRRKSPLERISHLPQFCGKWEMRSSGLFLKFRGFSVNIANWEILAEDGVAA